MTTELAALRRQLVELEDANRRGAMLGEAYEQAKKALESRIIAIVMQGASSEDAAAKKRNRALIAGASAVFVLVTGAGIFWLSGPPTKASKPAAVPAEIWTGKTAAPIAATETGGGHSGSSGQLALMLDKLATRLKQNPDDADGWAMLARSYAVTGRHADAVPAFGKAVALRKDDAVLLADYADALAMVQGRSFEGEPLTLVRQALKLDPNNVKALSLAGSAAFDRKDYSGAIEHWERLMRVAPPDSPFIPGVKDGIAQARERSGMTSAARPASETPAKAR